jgi:hypothetical protein
MLLWSGILLPTLIQKNWNMSREMVLFYAVTDSLKVTIQNHNFVLYNLILHTLLKRWGYFQMPLVCNIYNSFLTCPTFLEAVGIRVLARNITDFNVFLFYSHLIQAFCNLPLGRK